MKRRFGKALDLKTKADVEAYKALSKEGDDILYRIAKPLTLETVKSDRDSALGAAVVVAAHQDLLRARPIFDVITDAAHGTHFDADTSVDDVMNGRTPTSRQNNCVEPSTPPAWRCASNSEAP